MTSLRAESQATPPFTPPRAHSTAQHIFSSADESPGSRTVLRKVREKGLEHRWRTRSGSGELHPGIPNRKRAIQKASRRRHNLNLAGDDDVLPPPPPPPVIVNGTVGCPSQDAALQPPPHLTRQAVQAGWEAPSANTVEPHGKPTHTL
jgi:hypothetical protein